MSGLLRSLTFNRQASPALRHVAAIMHSTDKSLNWTPASCPELQVWAPADVSRLRQIPASQAREGVQFKDVSCIHSPQASES